MDILDVRNVYKTFSNHRALTDVSMSVPEGSVYGLLGPNGAGKTTLIRIINQITAPDEGSVHFNGHPLKNEDIYQIGYLPEERGLYRKMKVGEQALYLAQLKGMSKSDATAKLVEWFRKFEIESWWDKKVEELSKGMQQKIQFITTILHQPKLLIFDEPFSGFDPINAKILKNEILSLKDKGATIIFSTHNMESVEELCDHMTLINNSKTILEGAVHDIKNAYKTETFIIEHAPEKDIDALNQLDKNHFDVKTNQKEANLWKSVVQLKNGKTENDLLAELIKLTSVKSFKEVIPSMNDIFIQVVNDNK